MKDTEGRAKYQQLWDITAEVIRSWDPYDLIRGGAPRDEFDKEIALVVAQIRDMHSASDATRAISRIFSSSIDEASFTEQECSAVGEQLYVALKARELIL
jgi:Domain of unknown function (DUF1871)